MRRLLLILALTPWLVAWPAIARADDQTSSRGQTSATFSFSFTDDPWGYGDLWLTISREGQILFDDAPDVGDCDHFNSCGPAGGQRDSLHVEDLDGDGEPEIRLDLYWGGAHCCFFSNIYYLDGASYRSVSRNFADPGYRVGDIDGDGVPEFVSADARFAYRFTSFASSFFPIQIWSFDKGTFYDQTDMYPARIRSDADDAWRWYRSALRGSSYEPRGAIAAWAADRYRLGKRTGTLKTLRELAREGKLRGAAPKSQQRFVADLDGFLRRAGYAD